LNRLSMPLVCITSPSSTPMICRFGLFLVSPGTMFLFCF
jgi:hypothetical protein